MLFKAFYLCRAKPFQGYDDFLFDEELDAVDDIAGIERYEGNSPQEEQRRNFERRRFLKEYEFKHIWNIESKKNLADFAPLAPSLSCQKRL